MRSFECIAAMLLLVGIVGCQCSPLTDRQADVIDHVADSQPTLDCLYHPYLDLTRIGQPDWCQCLFNRLWCHRACGGPYCDSCQPICCPFCAEDFPPYEEPADTPAKHLENGKSPAKAPETTPPEPSPSKAAPPEPERRGSTKPPVPDMSKNGSTIPYERPKTSRGPLRPVVAQTGRPSPKARSRSLFRWK